MSYSGLGDSEGDLENNVEEEIFIYRVVRKVQDPNLSDYYRNYTCKNNHKILIKSTPLFILQSEKLS